MKKIDEKIKKIKIILTDVDGVLTDGGMYYSANGDMIKKFHARDGMGISILKRNIQAITAAANEEKVIKKSLVFFLYFSANGFICS